MPWLALLFFLLFDLLFCISSSISHCSVDRLFQLRDLAKMLLRGYWDGEYRFLYQLEDDGSVEIGTLHKWMCDHATCMQHITEQRVANTLAYASDEAGRQMFVVFQKPESSKTHWKTNRALLLSGGCARIVASPMHRSLYQELHHRETDRNWLVHSNRVGLWTHRDIQSEYV